jgi:ankyrin repeat protein
MRLYGAMDTSTEPPISLKMAFDGCNIPLIRDILDSGAGDTQIQEFDRVLSANLIAATESTSSNYKGRFVLEVIVAARSWPSLSPQFSLERLGSQLSMPPSALVPKILLLALQHRHYTMIDDCLRTLYRRHTENLKTVWGEDSHSVLYEAVTILDHRFFQRLVGYDLLERLMEIGIPVDHPIKARTSALHAASRVGNSGYVEVLIEHVDANLVDESQETALHVCARSGFVDVVKVLLSAGADVASVNSNGCTPLHLAALSGHSETVAFLLSVGSDLSFQDKFKRTPIFMASAGGWEGIVETLLRHGAPTSPAGHWGQTPLHLAAYNCAYGVAKILLDKGANIDAKDGEGVTPLHAASIGGLDNMVSLLLQSGANINLATEQGLTALHFAAISKHASTALLERLLTNGALVNAVDKDDLTALEMAQRHGNFLIADRIESFVNDQLQVHSPKNKEP